MTQNNQGQGGTITFDPLNILISNGSADNTTGFAPGTDQIEAFADDADKETIFNANTSFSGCTGSVTLQANNNIIIDDNCAWLLPDAVTGLTLNATNMFNMHSGSSIKTKGTVWINTCNCILNKRIRDRMRYQVA